MKLNEMISLDGDNFKESDAMYRFR